MQLTLEFGGGLELLCDSKKIHNVNVEFEQQNGEDKLTMKGLLSWVRTNLIKERPEMFMKGDTVRPGVLVLVNDCDWELSGQLNTSLEEKDVVVFISTLHGEWDALRDQSRYNSQVGGNIGSGSSGSKRSHESDAYGSNYVGSSVRPMGRETAKKKGKKKSKKAALEALDKEWSDYRQLKEKELEQLDKMNSMQQEANQLTKMELYLKLSSEEHLNDRKKELLKKLEQKLFDN